MGDALRGPDPTLSHYAVNSRSDRGGYVAVDVADGKPPRAHRPDGPCPVRVMPVIHATDARWFAIPCLTCWPAAPMRGHTADHVRRQVLAWQVAA